MEKVGLSKTCACGCQPQQAEGAFAEVVARW